MTSSRDGSASSIDRTPQRSLHPTRESERPMRRTPAITLAGVTALALTVSACGREDAGCGAAETGEGGELR